MTASSLPSTARLLSVSYRSRDHQRPRYPAAGRRSRDQGRDGSRTGRDALDVSEAIADYKRADAPDINEARQTRKIGEKLFTRVNGVWIDSGFKKEMPLAKITCLSDEYFAQLSAYPEIARFLALADRTIFHHHGKTAISIVP